MPIYYAKKIQQWPGAPTLYVIECKPSELLGWADVPRKAPQWMEGYQRALEDRYERITEFLEFDINNILPGAVVVASHHGDNLFKIEPVKDCGDHGFFRIEFLYEQPRDLRVALGEILQEYERRLGEGERVALKKPEFLKEPDGEDEIQDYAEGINSRMAAFVRSLRQLFDDWDVETTSLDEPTKKKWEEWILASHKPGNILDGQHRVFGALEVNPARCQHVPPSDEPRLCVAFIPSLSAAEQVFHFSIMNLTAVKVKAQHARANASFSLSQEEIERYETRLARFVNVEDARWVDEMSRSPESPFKGKIYYDMFKKESGFFKESVAVQLQRLWRQPPPELRSLVNTKRWNDNDDDFQMKAFFVFWKAVSEYFADDWANQKSQIWMKVAVLLMQEFVLLRIKDQLALWMENRKHPFEDVVSLFEFVRFIVKRFPSDFFSKKWQVHSLDDSDGHRFFLRQLQNAYESNRKTVDKRWALFRVQS